MPLKCLTLDGSPIYAYDFTPDAFEALRQAQRVHSTLTFPCCGAPAGLRVSSKGLQHFYHVEKKSSCAQSLETEAHRKLKQLIVMCAREEGWSADCEVASQPESVEAWRADVLLTKGRARVAIEVQLSRVPWGDIVSRQERYRAAGVRGLWLLRQDNYGVSHETPAFQVRETETGEWQVRISPPRDDLNVTLTAHGGNWYRFETFLQAALNKNLVWAPVLELNRADVLIRCRRHSHCQCGNLVLLPISLAVSLPYPGHRSLLWTIKPGQSLHANPGPDWLNALVRLLNQSYPEKSGAQLAVRLTRGRALHYYACPFCNAEIDDVEDRYTDVTLRRNNLPVKGVLPEPATGSAEEAFLHQWWLRVPVEQLVARSAPLQMQLSL